MTKRKNHSSAAKCTNVRHHQHMRKRLSSRRFQLSLVDKLVYVAGPMIPVAIIPQVYSVWVLEEVQGVALVTWIILSITSFSMGIYAAVHREKPLIMTYVPLFLLNISVVIGVILKT